MNARYYHLSFTLAAVLAVGCIFAKTVDSSDVRLPDTPAPEPTALPSPAIKPCEPEMSKIKPNATPQPVSGPISSQASSVGESRAVRDIPAATPGQSQEPREINPQNTIPLKTVKPCPAPTVEPALLRPPVQKNKLQRRKKRH